MRRMSGIGQYTSNIILLRIYDVSSSVKLFKWIIVHRLIVFKYHKVSEF